MDQRVHEFNSISNATLDCTLMSSIPVLNIYTAICLILSRKWTSVVLNAHIQPRWLDVSFVFYVLILTIKNGLRGNFHFLQLWPHQRRAVGLEVISVTGLVLISKPTVKLPRCLTVLKRSNISWTFVCKCNSGGRKAYTRHSLQRKETLSSYRRREDGWV